MKHLILLSVFGLLISNIGFSADFSCTCLKKDADGAEFDFDAVNVNAPNQHVKAMALCLALDPETTRVSCSIN